jgi:hypothetical protein
MSSGPLASVNDPSPFIVAILTGMPSTGEPVAVVYETYMTHCFAFPDVFTTQEPVMLSLLCSERTPRPGVVVPAAVVVANDGNTVGDELPRSAPPTIEPCPGSAWVGAIAAGALCVDDAVLDAVSAVAIPPESVTKRMVTPTNMTRRNFIAILWE